MRTLCSRHLVMANDFHKLGHVFHTRDGDTSHHPAPLSSIAHLRTEVLTYRTIWDVIHEPLVDTIPSMTLFKYSIEKQIPTVCHSTRPPGNSRCGGERCCIFLLILSIIVGQKNPESERALVKICNIFRHQKAGQRPTLLTPVGIYIKPGSSRHRNPDQR